MKSKAEDWMFVTPHTDGVAVAVDLFLDNGQHARLEILPLLNLNELEGDQVPEIAVLCEMPGEDLHRQDIPPRRWLARPPNRHCHWSQVELAEILVHEINQRLAALMSPSAADDAQVA